MLRSGVVVSVLDGKMVVEYSSLVSSAMCLHTWDATSVSEETTNGLFRTKLQNA